MNTRVRTKSKNEIALLYFIALLFILGNGCEYTHLITSGHLDAIVSFLPGAMLIAYVFLYGRRIRRDYFAHVLVISFYLIVFIIISGSDFLLSLAQLIMFSSIMLYYYSLEVLDRPLLLQYYRDIIVIIAAISLFFWFFGSLTHILSPTSTVISNWGTSGNGSLQTHLSYYMLYFENGSSYIMGRFIVSNRSIFVERAFAAYSFSIGLLYELCVESKKSIFRILILVIAIISTFSITGLILMVITIWFFYSFSAEKSLIRKITKIIIVPGLLIVGSLVIRYLLIEKISMGHSFSSRLKDFENGFDAWKNSILYGYGYGNDYLIWSKYHTGYSNSITMVMTRGGLMLGALYAFAIIKGIISSVKKRAYMWLMFICIFLISISFTAVAFTNTTLYCFVIISSGVIPGNMCIENE